MRTSSCTIKRIDRKAAPRYVKSHHLHGVRRSVGGSAALPSAISAKSTAAEKTSRRFDFYCSEWLQMSQIRIKASTYAKYFLTTKKHIEPALGQLSPCAITSQVVEEFSHQLLWEEGLSPKTVKDILVQLKSILDYTAQNCPEAMPAIRISYPKEPYREMRVLSPEEQKKLTSYLIENTDSGKFGVLLSLMTGMRIGELCALRWGDISLAERVIHVRATMQRITVPESEASGSAKTRVVIGDPKSYTSARLIPLTDHAIQLLRQRQASDPAAFVLTGTAAHFMEPRVLQYKLARYTEDCGLAGVHFHTLRHSFATRCVEVDFEIKSLSEILGHADPQITLSRYVHSSMELKRSNMEKLNHMGY